MPIRRKNPDTVAIEDFDVAAAQAGLILDADERQRLYEGYKGLLGLLARLPDGPAMEDEPAVIALEPGTKVSK
jgi:hypothetical protein